MSTTPPEHGSDPAASTTPLPTVDPTLQLSTQTLDWLAKHPRAGRLVRSVWDKITELERTAGQHSGPLDALRRILILHQPTPAGRCPTCSRKIWRHRPFPCIVWHQVRLALLGHLACHDHATQQ